MKLCAFLYLQKLCQSAGDLGFDEILSHLRPHVYFPNAFKCLLIPAHRV